jgi:hypothetical protein
MNVLIVIRSAHERTEAVCQSLILKQGVPPEQVVVVRETPFSAALEKSFRLGIEYGYKWTLCVDADVLLRSGSVARMLELIEQESEEVCEIQGYILDKFFGGPREGGIHLYRTSLLGRLLDLVVHNETKIRPEGSALTSMKEAGFPWKQVPYIVGIHDFEQSYRDVFRKNFVQAHKHLYRAELLLTVFRKHLHEDKDFEIALKGFNSGVVHSGEVRIDVKQAVYKNEFEQLQIAEKPELLGDAIRLSDIDRIIREWKEPAVFYKYFAMGVRQLEEANQKLNISSVQDLLPQTGWRASVKKRGYWGTFVYSVGWLLEKTGRRLKNHT